MLTYVYFGTNDLERATRFYDATQTPLDMQRCINGDPAWDRISAGWGIYEDNGARKLAFWNLVPRITPPGSPNPWRPNGSRTDQVAAARISEAFGSGLKPSNGASHFSVNLRPPRLRLSRPANQRLVSVAPNRRRSLSRRSAFLRYLHEQCVGIVQASNGRRGASRSR
jgi:hypothetical protein